MRAINKSIEQHLKYKNASAANIIAVNSVGPYVMYTLILMFQSAGRSGLCSKDFRDT